MERKKIEAIKKLQMKIDKTLCLIVLTVSSNTFMSDRDSLYNGSSLRCRRAADFLMHGFFYVAEILPIVSRQVHCCVCHAGSVVNSKVLQASVKTSHSEIKLHQLACSRRTVGCCCDAEEVILSEVEVQRSNASSANSMWSAEMCWQRQCVGTSKSKVCR